MIAERTCLENLEDILDAVRKIRQFTKECRRNSSAAM